MSSPLETSVLPEAIPPALPPTAGNESHAALPPELIPNLDELVIEDDTPVDSIFAEKQQRLLAEPLYSSWPGPGENRSFQVFVNVGLFFAAREDPLVPDAMLAIEIPTGGDLALRRNRSYFVWERGKPPDVAIEVVSDRRGREEDFKFQQYARIGVPFYVIFDPADRLHHGLLRSFIGHGGVYEPLAEPQFPLVGLGLLLWEGVYEGYSARWLRWCDDQRRVIPTGQERAEQQQQRAEQQQQRAEQLEAKLRALGVDPRQP